MGSFNEPMCSDGQATKFLVKYFQRLHVGNQSTLSPKTFSPNNPFLLDRNTSSTTSSDCWVVVHFSYAVLWHCAPCFNRRGFCKTRVIQFDLWLLFPLPMPITALIFPWNFTSKCRNTFIFMIVINFLETWFDNDCSSGVLYIATAVTICLRMYWAFSSLSPSFKTTSKVVS